MVSANPGHFANLKIKNKYVPRLETPNYKFLLIAELSVFRNRQTKSNEKFHVKQKLKKNIMNKLILASCSKIQTAKPILSIN